MTDQQIEHLIRLRDAGDSEADDQLSAWIEQCLAEMFIPPPDADATLHEPTCAPHCWCSPACATGFD